MNKSVVLSSNTAWFLVNFRSGLIRSLICDGYKIFILAPEDKYSDHLRQIGCTVIGLQMDNKGTNPFRDMLIFLNFRKHYRSIRPLAVLNYTIKPVIYGSIAAKSLNIPCINMVTGLGTAFITENWITRIAEFLYRVSQRKVEKTFFLNNDDYKVFLDRKLAPCERMEQFRGEGVDLEYFAVKPLPGGNTFNFLFVGRLIRDKGVYEYVAAARQVKEKHPNARFYLLGPVGVDNRTSISLEVVNEWVAEGILEYLGETDDVRPFIEGVHCVVLPSYREGSPRSLIEGAAMGRPLIATDTVGCRDIVNDGVNGYLCRVRDKDDLADKMVKMLLMPEECREAMGKAGRVMVDREFDESVITEKYRTILARIVDKGTSQ